MFFFQEMQLMLMLPLRVFFRTFIYLYLRTIYIYMIILCSVLVARVRNVLFVIFPVCVFFARHLFIALVMGAQQCLPRGQLPQQQGRQQTQEEEKPQPTGL